MCVSSRCRLFGGPTRRTPRVPAPGYAIVSPCDGEEGIGYGEGRGTAIGRIEDTVVWSNYPRRRTDGRMLPDARGLVTTHDGASILFELRGRTIFEGDEPGRQNLVGWFESDHESYRWLNDVVCIAEGTIDPDGMEIDIYAGVHEMGLSKKRSLVRRGLRLPASAVV
jgi:Protein of unknown function (DUF3237)